ncbi:MAG: hypothetical protein WAM59_00605 [Candidatus Acidiferrales bacterium]
MAAHAANDSHNLAHRPAENSSPFPTKHPTSRVHPPELEKQIAEIQSRLRAFIEATRPAHEAYLRTANRNTNPAAQAQNSKEKTMSSTAVTTAKNLLRASANATTTNTKSSTRKSSAPPQFLRSTPDLARHRRKCTVCHHPEREAIEDLFIHWHSPEAICNIFNDKGIGWIAVYRHAYALGLDEVRRRNLRFVFEHILDQADQITPTPASIIAAAHALGACVNDTGQWHEPPRRVLVTNIVKKEASVGADRLHRPPREARQDLPRAQARQSSATAPNDVPAEPAPQESSAEAVGAALRRRPSASAEEPCVGADRLHRPPREARQTSATTPNNVPAEPASQESSAEAVAAALRRRPSASAEEPCVGADRTHRPPRNARQDLPRAQARQSSATAPNDVPAEPAPQESSAEAVGAALRRPPSAPETGAPSFVPSAKGGFFDETPEPGREIRNSRNSHITKESQISNR